MVNFNEKSLKRIKSQFPIKMYVMEWLEPQTEIYI